jgi:hypothetical protein
LTKFILSLVSSAAISFAAAPLATVASDGAFTLDGKPVAVRGVMSWPVLSGDKIATTASPALISFRDGSTISLSANSVLRVGGSETSPLAVLEAGELDYNIPKDSKLAVSKLSEMATGAHKSIINKATVGGVVATSLVAGAGAAAASLNGSAATGSVSTASPASLALKPPPLSRFQ